MPDRLSSRDRRALAGLTGQLRALDEDIALARASLQQLTGHSTRGAGIPRLPLRPLMYGERVRLPDGTEILIRPIVPDDAEELEFELEHLSALSRYRRFRAPVSHLTPRQLHEATHVDHLTHETLVALDPAAHEGIGLAEYVIDRHDPTRAEVDFVVIDRWQGRGVARLLIERIAARALGAGVEGFTATMLVGNEAARATVARVADIVAEETDGAVAVITARLRTVAS